MHRSLLVLALLLARAAAQIALPEGFSRAELTVGGDARHAFIYAPASAKTAPAASTPGWMTTWRSR